MMNRTTTTAAVVVAAAAAAASHAGIALSTSGNTLFRTDLGTGVTETFQLSDDIVSQSVMSDGRIIAYSNSKGPNGYEVYELTGALGAAPSLSLLTDTRSNRAYTHVEVGETIYAIRDGKLFTADPLSFELSLVKNLGVGGVGGMAYDDATGTMYMLSGNTDSLYRIDNFDTANPSAVLIGDTGVQVTNQGLEMFDGTLYAAIQDNDADTLSVGTIDMSTGAFTGIADIALTGSGPTSIAVVVPTPGAAALACVAGLAAVRRRRG